MKKLFIVLLFILIGCMDHLSTPKKKEKCYLYKVYHYGQYCGNTCNCGYNYYANPDDDLVIYHLNTGKKCK